MVRSRYRIFETEYPCFLSCTVIGWLSLFTRPEAVKIVLDFLALFERTRRRPGRGAHPGRKGTGSRAAILDPTLIQG